MKFELIIAIMSGIGSLIGWGLVDFFSANALKKNKMSEAQATFVLYLITSTILWTIVALTMKNLPHISPISIIQVSIFAFLNVAAYLLFFSALKIGTLGTISTIFATYSVGASFISILFFNEQTTPLRLLSLLIVFVGIAAVCIQDYKSFKLIKGFRLAIIAAILLSIFFPFLDSFLSNNSGGIFWAALINSIMTIFFLIYLLSKKEKMTNITKKARVMIFAGIANAVGVISLNWGFESTSLTSVIVVVSSAVPLVSATLGYYFFKERLHIIQYIGIIIIVSGMALLFSS